MNEPTLFDQIADDPALEEELENEPFQEPKKSFEDIAEEKDINTMPDDLTVIRTLLSKNIWADADDLGEYVDQFVQKQLRGKFDMYEFSQKELDEFEEWCVDKTGAVFCNIQDILIDAFEICSSEMHSIFLGVTEDNIDYLAYLYNLNAPYHGKETLPYQELKKAFQEGLSNKQ